MNTEEYLACKTEVESIKKDLFEVKEMFRLHCNYMTERNRKLRTIDSMLTLLEEQVTDIRKRVKYLCEQSNKD